MWVEGVRVALGLKDALELYQTARAGKDGAIEWLDSIAGEAREVANIWLEVHSEIREFQEVPSAALRGKLRKFEISRNQVPYARLSAFYARAEGVIAGKIDRNVHQEIMDRLGSFLVERDFANATFSEVIAMDGAVLRLNVTEPPRSITNLEEAVEVLNQEAAALEALVAGLRARR